MFEKNTQIASQTITTSGNAASVNVYDNLPAGHAYLEIDVTYVTGNPNAMFYVQTSPDNATWYNHSYDEYGPVNAPGVRYIAIDTRRPYMRYGWLMHYNDPGAGLGGSTNSSSLSGGSFVSSSNGGADSVTFSMGLVPSITG